MIEHKFNYCIPIEYKDKEGKINYRLCKGGEKMQIDTLANIQQHANFNLPKDAQPWCQVFNNGYRVTKDRLKWDEWTGFTFSDIDSKWFYNYEKPFNVEALLKAIIEYAPIQYNYNYYASHLTNSKKGYRIFWYWNCDRTEENFKKCCVLTEQYTRKLFYYFGDQAKQIIDYKLDKHKVLDHCSTSIMQGFYITMNSISYSPYIDDKDFGYVELDDITLDEIYQTNSIVPTNGNYDQHSSAEFIDRKAVNKDKIKYYPHQHRRCIYEALIVLFKDKEKVDEEWRYICELLPETDNISGGHSKQFYLNEPNKNRWYDKFNKKEIHRLDWLDTFGYKYVDSSNYIYINQFKNSWKRHCWGMLIMIYKDFKKEEYIKQNSDNVNDNKFGFKKFKQNEEELNSKWYEEFCEHNIFDEYFDNILDDDRLNEFNNIRSVYYKTRWTKEDFKYLCNGYDIPKDIVTYKMYADFYYRDNNNLPIIKYDVLEDEIQVLGYWPETNKVQYHQFKYGNEYTHWKNNDEFSNSCNKIDMREAINKYVPRWHNYHVIKDYLNSLDLSKANEELLETWAIRYFKCDDTKLTREICKKFFIAAVKKQMIEKPADFVFQHMLFLQGPTGCGKTFFLVNMFTIDGHSFILNKIDPNGKDSEIGPLIAKNWLIQFGESENLKKISVNAAKEFMDRINLGMKYQKKWENEQTTVYPRIMACRTSNDETLFNDISISEGDRRNWLLVCKTGVNACDAEMREKMKSERDILWATAYKLYLDDPEQELELTNEAFSELALLQEDYKLIKTSDVEETYNEIFNRKYLTNCKYEIKDETSFNEMLKHSDIDLNNSSYYADSLQETSYAQENKIKRIPCRWISEYVKKKYGINHWTLLKKYMLEHNWTYKTAKYNNLPIRCFEYNYI